MRKPVYLGALLWAVLAGTGSAQGRDLQPVTTEISSESQRAEITDRLRNGLEQLGFNGAVERCSFMLDYVQPTPTGKDTSWGAICSIAFGGRRRTILACDDRMIDKFSLTENFTASRAGVTGFIERKIARREGETLTSALRTFGPAVTASAFSTPSRWQLDSDG